MEKQAVIIGNKAPDFVPSDICVRLLFSARKSVPAPSEIDMFRKRLQYTIASAFSQLKRENANACIISYRNGDGMPPDLMREIVDRIDNMRYIDLSDGMFWMRLSEELIIWAELHHEDLKSSGFGFRDNGDLTLVRKLVVDC